MSNRWPGGIIRKTPVTPAGPLQNGAAPGMWTLAEAAFWTKQGLWPTQGNTLAVEDVFSTYLYTGNGSTQTITNGVNLSGQGGLVWVKSRTNAGFNGLTDTVRGVGQNLYTNSTLAQFFDGSSLTAFTSSGFSLGNDAFMNGNGQNYASWTFREAPNFFDVVTYTGNGSASQAIAHNLGSVPGCIIIKRTNATGDWPVYHRGNEFAPSEGLALNLTATTTSTYRSLNSVPTATEFVVGAGVNPVNASGGTYVAYLFAHNTASDGIIQCGSFTTNGSGQATVTLGWEPQWVFFKPTNVDSGWRIIDNMRGWTDGGNDPILQPNVSDAEFSGGNYGNPNATGFSLAGYAGAYNFIYVAIRRGPMRTPTLGTSVFSPVYATSASSPYTVTTNFPVDLVISTDVSGSSKNTMDRLRGGTTTSYAFVNTNSTLAESTGSSIGIGFQNNTAVVDNSYWSGYGLNVIYWNFRRAPGFMDVVCYTGTGSVLTQAHNLGVVPELMIVKRRSGTGVWPVYYGDATRALFLEDTAARGLSGAWDDTAPTATQFTINGASSAVGAAGSTYVAYLFASVPGVSKVGSYTGNGSSQTINCAFTTGARFVLIKRTDSTGDWYVWDSARGIVAGNDPYLALNSTAAQVTSNDSVDTDSTGFVVNQVAASNINVNAATYIFLAIA